MKILAFIAVQILLSGVEFNACAQTNSIAATNTASRWLTFRELQKKFDPLTVEKVKEIADHGDPMAQHYLGYSYMEGLRVEKNPASALSWYERAFAGGYLPSANNLGFMYDNGYFGRKDLGKAAQYYRLAADAGLDTAQVNLGSLYERQGMMSRALDSYREAAEQGSASAMVALYRMYWDGLGVESDQPGAMKWLAKAAETGDANAEFLMGFRHENLEWLNGSRPAVPVVPIDLAEAARWYAKAAEHGSVDGQFHLGKLYLEGTGVPQDESRALELIRAAADRNQPEAICQLASMYSQQIGEPRDQNESPFKLYLRAARAGNADAFMPLAFRYQQGLGTERDWIEASHLLCRSANGHILHGRGPGFDPDVLQASNSTNQSEPFLAALSLYLQAATKRDGAAMERIANMYLAGQNVPKKPSPAWLWFTIAAQHGAAGAASKASQLESQMTAAELAEAKKELPARITELNDFANILGPALSRVVNR